MDEGRGFEGPLAEFSALRQEIDDRIKAQHQFVALQLSLCGAIFAFAISRPGMVSLLLVVPFSSYMLCGRLVAQHFGTLQAARYIREELSQRVPGGLGWEAWRSRNSRGLHLFGSILPHSLTFVGSSLLAIGWTSGYVFGPGLGWAAKAGLVVVWVVGLIAACLSALLLAQMARERS